MDVVTSVTDTTHSLRLHEPRWHRRPPSFVYPLGKALGTAPPKGC